MCFFQRQLTLLGFRTMSDHFSSFWYACFTALRYLLSNIEVAGLIDLVAPVFDGTRTSEKVARFCKFPIIG